MVRAVFFDRDGVVNRQIVGDYVRTWEQFEICSEIFDVLPSVVASGYKAVLITNQQGVGKGFVSQKSLEDIHTRLQQLLAERTGFPFDGIYVCPHLESAACDCRKPKPGLLLEAASDLEIDLSRSWMIGDSISDVIAGEQAGVRTALLTGEDEGETSTYPVVPTIVGRTLAEVWSRIEEDVRVNR